MSTANPSRDPLSDPSAPIRGDQRSSAFVPPSLGDRKTQIYEIIRTRVGPLRALTADQIGQMVGIDARAVRSIITRLINDDEQGEICANTGEGDAFPGSPRGYFWASCAEDMIAYRNVLISRRDELDKRIYRAWQAIPRLPRKSTRQQRLIL